MSLPNFLSVNSPPRSPHGPVPGYFDAAISAATTPSRSRAGSIIRPTRRDVLLCLLTLSFSYLLFSPPQAVSPIQPPSGIYSSKQSTSSSKYRLPWSSIFHKEETCAPVSTRSGETTFTDSVKGYGVQSGDTVEVDDRWDGGEEVDEDDEKVPGETVLTGHQPGWTLFDNLYVYNGSFYVVTHDKNDWPELRMMTSTGLPALNEPGNIEAREPTGEEIKYITPAAASKLWGSRVYRMEGTSFLFNDGQFIDHYYHFAAELLLGAWRTYASLDMDITAQGHTTLTPPRRIWFLHQNVTEWRDKPKFNPTIMTSIFPSTAMLYPDDFTDLAKSTRSHMPNAFVMDRALLADRSAAFRGPWTAPTSRTVANALHVGEVSRWWWEPIRRQVLRYSGVEEEVIDRSLEGFGAVDPALRAAQILGPGVKDVEPLAPAGTYTPVVTYISRQSSRRRLTPEAHKDLVDALTERSKKVGFELNIVQAETLTKEEQFVLAAKTTIMLGVHGNGLTHLLWMPATPRSAVIEMFFRGGFARDYQWTAHALGIRHFAVQHDATFTSPNLPEVAYPEGFQGTQITVDGKTVADLIEDRLAGRV